MIRKRSLTLYLRLLRPVVHLALMFLIFFVTYKLRLVTDLIPGLQLQINPIDVGELKIYAIVAGFVFLGSGFFFGLYDLTKPFFRYKTRFLQSFSLWFVVIAFVAYFGHGIVFVAGISRLIIVWSGALVFLSFWLFDWLWNRCILYYQQFEPYRVLCVYQDASQFALVKQQLSSSFFAVEGMDADDWEDVSYEGFDYVMAIGQYDQEKIQSEFDKIRLAQHMFFHVVDGLFLEDVVYQSMSLGGVRAIAYMPSTLDGWRAVFKKGMDMVLGLIATVLLAPVMLVIALLIKLDSPGPILYLQPRIGRNGHSFTFVKFRTMYTHLCVGEAYGGEDAWKYKQELMDSPLNVRKGELQKIDNDPRVTRVGRFLRKTSLDELPSLFSVLWGTMSLVGPRPHEVFEVARYKDWQRRLLSMKPGITGYAQIHGRHTLTFDEEAKYELYYMQHWSLWLDLYVLLMTVKVVFSGR